MNRRLSIAATATMLAVLFAAPNAAAVTRVGQARGFAPHQLIVKFAGRHAAETVELPRQVAVRSAAAALRQSPAIAYAVPNYLASASIAAPASRQIPNDPGTIENPQGPPGGWVEKQWNFLPWEAPPSSLLPVSPGGIDAPAAWANLAAAGHPGAEGITVAVLDTGIAYRSLGRRFRRSPDFAASQFAKGYDFAEHDRIPLDENGHGTHVAGTIAEKTNNGIGLTGLAFRAKLMPVRVLDKQGRGRADDIASGIRFAVAHGADVINMSFNFGCGRRVPSVDEALKQAYDKGVVAVASVGNLGSEACVSAPATSPHVIGVGGSTQGGCIGDYSLAGEGVDVLAPGGGEPAPGCPSVWAGPIYQVTLRDGSTRRFAEPSDYVGTSMAAAHVSGVAAMILASGTLGAKLKGKAKVAAVTRRLRQTARSLGLPPTRQGAGLIDAGRATSPTG